ncbi:9-O-acetylesterase [Hymenobacter qilianensis]|uniref:9-O-acetylesterase n=2 Tax=Hymenobacter qilianensis TaxID=1385715 RepID=A0ACB5PPE8_9BACT|nr:sialate O-acetylesterase [Hymenobacter qilianensis]QNP53194.1 sialate O-acetylesterase [Hymenobacter qilianensis]GGF58874.1 9-O-acetylesterase [Hymenobacter qilianensis]
MINYRIFNSALRWRTALGRRGVLLALLGSGLITPAELRAEVRLPRLVSDGMVLQRDAKLTVWGWGAKGEKVTLRFKKKTYSATTGPDGKWTVSLPAQPAGGPYTMNIAASNQLELKDILVGDVWVCSGQSNMETPMSRLRDRFPEEIATANNPRIRQFTMPTSYSFKGPKDDIASGNWVSVSPQSIGQFSGVAYFFAKDLYAKYQVPIGLIKNAIGGSPAEAWLSAEALKQFPAYQQQGEQYKDSALVASIQQRDQAAGRAWQQRLYKADQGQAPGQMKWSAPGYDATGWATMGVPGFWADQTPLGQVNGVLWFRKEVEVPASMVGKPARLELGTLVDADSTYINGQLVGTTGYQYPPRKYDFGPGVLKPGKNVIVVRLISNGGRGGFTPDKQYQLSAGGQTLDLRGPWQYKLGAAMPPAPGSTSFQNQPGGLFNGMVGPLLPYAIKGVIWFQGESNTGKAQEYQQLFSAVITDWRKQWQRPTLPFLYVQLANFMSTRPQPGESGWAGVRDAQRQTLQLPNTGMVVAIDVGEWNDIHPLDKETVGKRLALAARQVAYGEKKLVASGPLYQSMQVKDGKAVLQFASVGGGLVAKGSGPLTQFAIAGPDKKFVWAQARIEGNTVVVWHDEVPAPAFVRYAWADNPAGANLYNKEGLPASPFQASSVAVP